jgi:hypothetical protein
MDTQANSIANELAAHIRRHGTKFCEWFVGVTANADGNLLRQQASVPPSDWIARDAGDADIAEDIEAYLHSFGCDGRSPARGRSSTVVFAYRKSA